MKKIFGIILILSAVLLAVIAYRFLTVMNSAGNIHASARALVIYIALVIVGISYLLRTGFRLLK
jgi:hypothetical protein